MSGPKIVGTALLCLVILYGIGFLMTGGNLFLYRFWMPQIRNAQTEVFMNSQAYVTGKISMLTRLRVAYEAAEAGSGRRAALREQILVEAAEVDHDRLPTSLRIFINGLGGTPA